MAKNATQVLVEKAQNLLRAGTKVDLLVQGLADLVLCEAISMYDLDADLVQVANSGQFHLLRGVAILGLRSPT